MPTVTQILAPYADFSGVPPDVLAHAAERGTAVHAACLAEVTGLWAVPDPEVEPYLDSFRAWLPNVEVINAEFELRDGDLVGHPDLLVKFRGDKDSAIIDLKTPIAYNPIWRAQLAAYRMLAEKNGWVIGRLASLRLKKDGGRPILNESTATYGRDLAGFLSARDAWKYFSALKERMI